MLLPVLRLGKAFFCFLNVLLHTLHEVISSWHPCLYLSAKRRARMPAIIQKKWGVLNTFMVRVVVSKLSHG